jgi:hypothetical protein
MGKQRNQMARIHGRKRRKAKDQLKKFRAGELPGEKLNSLAKRLLRKHTIAATALAKKGAAAKPAAAPAAAPTA